MYYLFTRNHKKLEKNICHNGKHGVPKRIRGRIKMKDIDFLKKASYKHKLLRKNKRENKFYVQLSNGQIIKLKALNADDALKEAEARFKDYDNKYRYMKEYIVFQYKKNRGGELK